MDLPLFLIYLAIYHLNLDLRCYPYVDGYFPINRFKLEYEELSEQYYIDDPNGVKVLTLALMKRAMESVRRVFRLQQEKGPLQQMVKQGVIGETLWEKLVAAEQEIEQEFKLCMEESNLYKPGWEATFIQEASQLVQVQMQLEAKKEQELLAKENQEKEMKAKDDQNDDDDGKDLRESPATSSTSESKQEKKDLSNLDDEARERLAQELIEEEEKEAALAAATSKKKKGKGKGGNTSPPGGHSKQGSKKNSTSKE